MENKPKTLTQRKKSQPKAVLFLSEAEKNVIAQTVAKNLSVEQKSIFFYTCQALGLNPLLNEIACVTYRNRKTGKSDMSIQVMRDGFLTIAHRSRKFAGIESGIKMDKEKILCGWARVFHKDFKVPVYQEADFEEYYAPMKGEKITLWKTKPKTMIKKVAESMALRKAFNISGVYGPEEMEKEIIVAETESLNKRDVKKIESAKTIDKLISVCKEVKEKNPQHQREIIDLYNKRKEEIK